MSSPTEAMQVLVKPPLNRRAFKLSTATCWEIIIKIKICNVKGLPVSPKACTGVYIGVGGFGLFLSNFYIDLDTSLN